MIFCNDQLKAMDDLGGRAFRCVANCVQLDTFWVVGCKGASALHHLF